MSLKKQLGEMVLEKQLLDQKLEAVIKQNKISAKTAAVKLPKLTITPFNGTAINWVRFKSQFSAKSESVQGVAYYVIIKKLDPLCSELATHVIGDWRSWTFAKLLEALRKWTTTNPIAESSGKSGSSKRSSATSERVFHSQDQYVSICVYCDDERHRSSECDKVATPDKRKAFLANNKLCFNCAAGLHKAISSPSKVSCRVCRKRHHTSLCVESSEPSLTTNIVGSSVVHPVVIFEVGGQKFRALLDSRASHSYVSSTSIELTHARAVKSGT